jgi:hypothetical protein
MSSFLKNKRSFDQIDGSALLSSLILVLSIVGLMASFVQSSYFQKAEILQLLSFLPNDYPAPLLSEMYPETFGVHYFGDLLLSLRLSEVYAPYETAGVYINTYPLFAGIVIFPLSLMPYWVAVPLFLIFTVSILIAPLTRLLAARSGYEKALLLAPLMVTAPMISVLDRANLQGIVVGFSLVGLVAYLRGNYKFAAIWFALAATMKATPVILLLLLVRVRAWKALMLAMFVGVFLTVSSSIFYKGGPVHNFLKWREAAAGYHDASFEILSAWNNSFLGLFTAVATTGPSFLHGVALWAANSYNIVLLLFFLHLVYFVTNKNTSFFSSTVYIAIFLSNGPPIAGAYTSLFFLLPIAVIFFNKLTKDLPLVLSIILISVYMAPKGILLCEENIFLYTFVNPVVAGLLFLVVTVKDVKSIRNSKLKI